MAEAAQSRPPLADHVIVKISTSAEIGVGVDFTQRPTVVATKLWTDPGQTGFNARHYFEKGGSIEMHYESKVGKPLLRSMKQMIDSIDREMRD